MMLVLCVVVAVGLLSLGEAAPLTNTCQDMLTPLQMTGPDLFLGKWMLAAESSEIPWSSWLSRTFSYAGWMDVTQGAGSTHLDLITIETLFGNCYSITHNVSFDKNTFTMVEPYKATINLYKTSCPDCLLLKMTAKLFGKTLVNLQLFSKRRELSADELDTFKQQAKCLNLYPPAILDPKIDLEKCQDSILRQDLTDFVQNGIKTDFVNDYANKILAMNTQEFIAGMWDSLQYHFHAAVGGGAAEGHLMQG